jgi:hypothetical protein
LLPGIQGYKLVVGSKSGDQQAGSCDRRRPVSVEGAMAAIVENDVRGVAAPLVSLYELR